MAPKPVTLPPPALAHMSPRAQENLPPHIAPPTIAITDASIDEDKGEISFTVTLSKASKNKVTVEYATADKTAAAGSDYVAASETLTFLPGETQKTISIALIDDFDVEDDETFFINLSNATNATITDAQAVGTVVNQDVAVHDPVANNDIATVF